MGIASDYGQLIESGIVMQKGVVATFEVRGEDHPVVHVYLDDGSAEKATQLGGLSSEHVAEMLLKELMGAGVEVKDDF